MNGSVRFPLGFTLVELIITIAIAAILLAVGIPSFQEIIKTNRMAANVNEFIAALNLARSEAIKRGVAVTVCKGTSTGCINSSAWQNGWIVFSDSAGTAGVLNAGTGACLATEDCILRVYPALSVGYTFDGNNNVTNRVTYDPRGMINTMGTLVMCDDRGFGENARAVVIARTGRSRAVRATEPTPALAGCQI